MTRDICTLQPRITRERARSIFVRLPVAALALLLSGCSSSPSSLGSASDAAAETDAVPSSPPGGDAGIAPPDTADATSSDALAASDAAHRDVATPPPDAACVPRCTNLQCGGDGCGGSCGTCPGAAPCVQGHCGACTPYCGAMVCGDDGCGGSCGTCPATYTCVVNGTCQLDPGSQCGTATCGSAASCCHCNGSPLCFALSAGETCASLGPGCD